MKTKTKIITLTALSIPVLVGLVVGCSSFRSRHIVDRISPATPSVEAVEGGYDTVGRMWSEYELARMRRARTERDSAKTKAAAQAPLTQTASTQSTQKPAAISEKSAAKNDAGRNENSADRNATRVTAPAPSSSTIEVKAGTVNLTIRAPGETSLGETFCYELLVTALDNVTNVFVEQTLSEDLVYESSNPQAQQQGRLLSWQYSTLSKGEKKTIKVCARSTKAGPVTSCATIYTKPQYCATTIIGKPILAITHRGPETVLLTSNATYTAVVSNKGDGVARNVVVTDTVPKGLAHESGKNVLTFTVGNLAPGESKTIPVTLKATARGEVCNAMDATADNAEKVSAEACTTVLAPSVKIVKTGDERQFINKTASYKIVVSNVGDTDLTGLTVTDTAPTGTSFANRGGGEGTLNSAVWKNVDLKKGEEKTFNVSLINRNKGEFCNVATVTTTAGQREEAKACTMWLGVSALLLEVTDEPDPLLVDEETTYTVRVTNQGTAEVKNLGLTANFSKHMEPVSAEKGTVQGKSVKFGVIESLGSKETVILKMKAKAVSIGDARVKVLMSSDILETPVTKEEATRVY